MVSSRAFAALGAYSALALMWTCAPAARPLPPPPTHPKPPAAASSAAAVEVPELARATLLVDSAPDGPVMNVALDPTGRLLAVCSAEARVRIYDLDARLRQLLAAPGEMIASLAWSPDGKRLAGASLGEQGGLAVWNVANGKLDRVLPASRRKPALVEWSPDGRRIAIVSGRELRLIDAATLDVVATIAREGWISSLAFHPNDGRLAVGGSGPRFSLVDRQGVVLHSTNPSPSLSDRYDSVSFSPDGKAVAALDHGARIALIDADNPSKPPTITGAQDAQVVGFGSKRDSLVVWGAKLLTVQNVERSLVSQKHAHTEGRAVISSRLDVRKDGRLVAVATENGASVWDLQRKTSIFSLRSRRDRGGAIATVGFSSDGALLYLARESTTVWDTRTGRISFQLASKNWSEQAARVALNQDRSLVAVVDLRGRATIGDTKTGEVVRQFDTQTSRIACLAFESAGRVLVLRAEGELEARRFDLDDGAAQKAKRAPCLDSNLVNPSRPQLLMIEHEPAVVDARSGALVKALRRPFSAAAWARDGSVAFLGNRDTIATLDSRSLKLVDWKVVPANSFTGLAVSPDGASLFVGSAAVVHAFDIQTKQAKPSFDGFDAGVAALALHPSGDFMASASALGVRLDRLSDRARIHLLPFADGDRVNSLAFTPDGVLDGDPAALGLAHYRIGDDIATSELRAAASMPSEFRTEDLVATFFAGKPLPKAPASVKRR